VPVVGCRTVQADAVKIVPNTAEDALYVHTDQLGTPRKLTDPTGAVVWDASLTPYGMEDSIAGTETLDSRFPGQWADAESGLNYNYFRDYDPTLGRYIQSDPIGLRGGLNTYAYVGGNPINYTDPKGLLPPLPPGYGPSIGDIGEFLKDLFRIPRACRVGPGGLPTLPYVLQQDGDDGAGGTKSVDDLIEDSTPGEDTSGRTDQFDKSGGFDQANEDFDALGPSDVQDIDTDFGPGRSGTLPGGRTAVVRPGSKGSANKPTLEIQKGKKRIKFRY